MINDLAEMFGLSRTAAMANLNQLGIVIRRIGEASDLYRSGRVHLVARANRQAIWGLSLNGPRHACQGGHSHAPAVWETSPLILSV